MTAELSSLYASADEAADARIAAGEHPAVVGMSVSILKLKLAIASQDQEQSTLMLREAHAWRSALPGAVSGSGPMN